jgi:hypothetical protein
VFFVELGSWHSSGDPEGESERGELQKARTRKKTSVAEEKKAVSERRSRLRRRENDGADFGGERTTEEMTG